MKRLETIPRGHLVTFVSNSKRVVWSLLNPGQCDSQERSRTAERKRFYGSKMKRDCHPWPLTVTKIQSLEISKQTSYVLRGIKRTISRKLVKIALTAGYISSFFKSVPGCRVSRHFQLGTSLKCNWRLVFNATGRQEEEDGRTLVCDKRGKAISYVFCRDLHLTSMFSGLLQKDLFKGKWILAKSYFKQNYRQTCHTRFAVFFPLPSCCVSSLLFLSRVYY